MQILGQARTQLGQDGAELGAVAHGVQIALEGGFAADADWLALKHDRAFVAAPGGFVQPAAMALAEVLEQPFGRARGQIADAVDAVASELSLGLGPDAMNLAAGQGPD